jgi:hypothetical protein
MRNFEYDKFLKMSIVPKRISASEIWKTLHDHEPTVWFVELPEEIMNDLEKNCDREQVLEYIKENCDLSNVGIGERVVYEEEPYRDLGVIWMMPDRSLVMQEGHDCCPIPDVNNHIYLTKAVCDYLPFIPVSWNESDVNGANIEEVELVSEEREKAESAYLEFWGQQDNVEFKLRLWSAEMPCAESSGVYVLFITTQEDEDPRDKLREMRSVIALNDRSEGTYLPDEYEYFRPFMGCFGNAFLDTSLSDMCV